MENGCKLLAVTSVLESVELLESLGDDDKITSSLLLGIEQPIKKNYQLNYDLKNSCWILRNLQTYL